MKTALKWKKIENDNIHQDNICGANISCDNVISRAD